MAYYCVGRGDVRTGVSAVDRSGFDGCGPKGTEPVNSNGVTEQCYGPRMCWWLSVGLSLLRPLSGVLLRGKIDYTLLINARQGGRVWLCGWFKMHPGTICGEVGWLGHAFPGRKTRRRDDGERTVWPSNAHVHKAEMEGETWKAEGGIRSSSSASKLVIAQLSLMQLQGQNAVLLCCERSHQTTEQILCDQTGNRNRQAAILVGTKLQQQMAKTRRKGRFRCQGRQVQAAKTGGLAAWATDDRKKEKQKARLMVKH